VRVLVRREGGTNTSNESTSAGNLRHYYLYLALASGAANRNEAGAAGPGTIGSGRAAGNQNTEVNQAKEFKLEALADLLLEYPLWQAIIHVGAQSTLDAVIGKLNSRQMENLSLVSK
jgi:translation initiation factor 4A